MDLHVRCTFRHVILAMFGCLYSFWLSCCTPTCLLYCLCTITFLALLGTVHDENKWEHAIDGLAEFLCTRGWSPTWRSFFQIVILRCCLGTILEWRMHMVSQHMVPICYLMIWGIPLEVSNHVFTGGCAGWLPHSITNLPVDCLDCLQESVFSDKVKSRYGSRCSCSDLGDAVVNNTSGTCQSFSADHWCFE